MTWGLRVQRASQAGGLIQIRGCLLVTSQYSVAMETNDNGHLYRLHFPILNAGLATIKEHQNGFSELVFELSLCKYRKSDCRFLWFWHWPLTVWLCLGLYVSTLRVGLFLGDLYLYMVFPWGLSAMSISEQWDFLERGSGLLRDKSPEGESPEMLCHHLWSNFGNQGGITSTDSTNGNRFKACPCLDGGVARC